MIRLIAVGSWPSHGELTIVSHPAYGELALLPGESVGEIVRAAEAVIEEMLARPWLGEPDGWTEDYHVAVDLDR